MFARLAILLVLIQVSTQSNLFDDYDDDDDFDTDQLLPGVAINTNIHEEIISRKMQPNIQMPQEDAEFLKQEMKLFLDHVLPAPKESNHAPHDINEILAYLHGLSVDNVLPAEELNADKDLPIFPSESNSIDVGESPVNTASEPSLITIEKHLGPAVLPLQVPEGYYIPFLPRKAFGVVNGVARPPHGHASFYNHRPRGLVDVRNTPAFGFLFSGYRRFQPQ